MSERSQGLRTSNLVLHGLAGTEFRTTERKLDDAVGLGLCKPL